MGSSQTSYSYQSDICPCIICPGDNFSSQNFLTKIFLATKIPLYLKIFIFFPPKSFLWIRNVFGTKLFLDPKVLFDSKLF